MYIEEAENSRYFYTFSVLQHPITNTCRFMKRETHVCDGFNYALLFSGIKWHGLGVKSLRIKKKSTFFIFKLRSLMP